MAEIRLLEPSVVNLIAAGEVVERPASAVKELVENAMDAGARHITIELQRGGLSLIRVSDDGCGMSRENAERAFLKHATSKIRTEDDLNRIHTLGFRGEALAAISAVSRVSLTTKESGSASGWQLLLQEGHLESCTECGCPEGSVFTVRDLFFNTPARLKFMKSEPAEAGAVQSAVERLALSHPDISFRLQINGSERLYTPGSGDSAAAVFSVLGKEFAEMMLPVNWTEGDIRVHGFVGKPIYSKANRTRQIFFLNGRCVRSPILTSGLEAAYHNRMLIGRMPVCVLFLDLPAESVDINVHPSKLEVKFSDENAAAYAVRTAAETAIKGDNGILEMQLSSSASPDHRSVFPEKADPILKKVSISSVSPKSKSGNSVNPGSSGGKPLGKISAVSSEPAPKAVREVSGWTITSPAASTVPESSLPKKTEASATPKSPCVSNASVSVVSIPLSPAESFCSQPLQVRDILAAEPSPVPAKPPVVPPFEQKQTAERGSAPEPVPEPVLFSTPVAFRLIGEAFHCYAIVEKEDELLLIDKHALHERMNFEKMRRREIPSQGMLQPIVLNIGREENRILGENADFLSRFGFMLESFGDDLLVREIPALIDPEDAEPLLQQFADSLSIGRDDSLMDRFYYDIACKASIRSGSQTSFQELEGLIQEYFRRCDELQYCPHGRPIVFSLSKKSIEKQFKRLK